MHTAQTVYFADSENGHNVEQLVNYAHDQQTEAEIKRQQVTRSTTWRVIASEENRHNVLLISGQCAYTRYLKAMAWICTRSARFAKSLSRRFVPTTDIGITSDARLSFYSTTFQSRWIFSL